MARGRRGSDYYSAEVWVGRVHVDTVRIQGLRGIREGLVEGLLPLTVLTGPNACGKSTVVDALLLGGAVNAGEALARVVSRRRHASMGSRWLLNAGRSSPAVVTLTGQGVCAQTAIGVGPEPRGPQWDAEAEARLRRPVHTLESSVVPQRGDRKRLGAALVGADNEWLSREFGTREPGVPPGGVELLAMGWEPLHLAYGRVVRAGNKPEALGFAAALFGAGVDLEALPEEHGGAQLYVTPRGGLPVPVGVAGDGVAAGLQVVMEAAASTADVLLAEEPEAHQHPASMRAIAAVLVAAVSRDKQVILTTHSLEMLDALLEAAGDAHANDVAVCNLALRGGTVHVARRAGAAVPSARFEIGVDLR